MAQLRVRSLLKNLNLIGSEKFRIACAYDFAITNEKMTVYQLIIYTDELGGPPRNIEDVLYPMMFKRKSLARECEQTGQGLVIYDCKPINPQITNGDNPTHCLKNERFVRQEFFAHEVCDSIEIELGPRVQKSKGITNDSPCADLVLAILYLVPVGQVLPAEHTGKISAHIPSE